MSKFNKSTTRSQQPNPPIVQDDAERARIAAAWGLPPTSDDGKSREALAAERHAAAAARAAAIAVKRGPQTQPQRQPQLSPAKILPLPVSTASSITDLSEVIPPKPVESLGELQAAVGTIGLRDFAGATQLIKRIAAARLQSMDKEGLLVAIKAHANISMSALRQGLEEALREIGEKAKVVSNRSWLQKVVNSDYDDKPLPIMGNVALALREDPEWQGVLGFNEFTEWVTLRRPPPWLTVAERAAFTERSWEDADGRKTTEWMQMTAGVIASSLTVLEAATMVAEENPFHPVRDYLDGLVWDGKHRLDDWLSTYLGATVEPSDDKLNGKDKEEDQKRFAAQSAYLKAIGSRWMIGAVRRIYRPGEKVDCALVLVGPQGILKSTVFSVLGGEWFTDQVPDLGSKDAAIQLAGIWIVEFAEFLSIRSVDVNASKKWMTIRKDRYRAPYGRHSSDHPRQSVFGGTTNDHEFLSDPTGARRFWSAVCGEKIDIEALRRDRDQLFAEAVHRHRAGEPHWLDTADLQAAAAVEAEEHYIQHPWEALIQEWLIEGNKTVAFTNEILIKALGKLRSDLGRKDQMTVSACLVRLGWKKGKQIRSGLHKGDRPYYPPPDPDQQQKPPPEPPLWAKVKA